MKKRNRVGLLSVIVVSLISIGVVVGINYSKKTTNVQTISTYSTNKNGTSVHFIDVDQGDCELIVDKDKTVLIDGGESDKSSKVTNYLKDLGIQKIDYMVATHPHSDHVGGLTQQIKKFKVDNLIMPKIPHSLIPTTKAYTDLLKEANDSKVNIIEAKQGLSYKLNEGEINILGPIRENYDELNDFSVPLKFTINDRSFFIGGDMEHSAENDVILSGQNLKSDVLKINHHGSNTSSTQNFLNKVNADTYVIEVGKNNKYHHPDQKVIERINGKPIYRTDRNGDIVMTILDDKIETKTSK